jgi:hypothetical protein
MTGRRIVAMTRKLALLAAAVVALALVSCAGVVYTRGWTYQSASLTDTLRLSRGEFRLERESSEGPAVFSGTLAEKGDTWTFVIDSWKPTNAAVRRLDPPITYIYRVKKFQDAISFLSMDVRGSSTLVFIQPGDFQAR